MDVYFYILPLQPDLNDYVISILTLLLPFMIMMYSNRIAYERDEIKEHEFGKGFIKLVDIPFLFIVVFLVLMIMDIGPFKLVGIETGSMTPTIRVGDAVLIDKKVNKDKLKVKDIIAYKNKDGILVVHRIIKINSDGTFITKGDANNSADTLYVNKDQIKGKVKLKIPFIAYPKILFK
jgi:signal peptidase